MRLPPLKVVLPFVDLLFFVAVLYFYCHCNHGPYTPVDERYNADASVDNGYPIKHVVVIVKENHTFDNYFGSFPGADGFVTTARATDYHQHDLPHQRSDALRQWNHGSMDGWTDSYAQAQYFQKDIPAYWLYAQQFTLADHFFASSFGPSFPGHLFTIAAQAARSIAAPPTNRDWPFWGCDQKAGNRAIALVGCDAIEVYPCFDIPSLPDVLPPGVSWRYYGTNFYGLFNEIWSLFDAIRPIRANPRKWAEVVAEDQLTEDIANHALPNVSWLVDQDFASEHPAGGSPCMGENWTEYYINAIMQSEYWPKTAILITWDDPGGWYDHVVPPVQYGCEDAPYGLGFRLPLIIVSPYAKRGFVFHEVAEQASIPRFIERVFGAGLLSDIDPVARDGVSNDLFNCFDFNQKPREPLVILPRKCPDYQ